MKKNLSLMGMIVGIAIAIFGILAISGNLGSADSYADASYIYDMGYAEFGADYYTYSVNNTAWAAHAAAAAAANQHDITDLLKNCLGLFMIGFGLLSFCGFAIVFVDCPKTSQSTTATEEDLDIEDCKENSNEADVDSENFSAEIIDNTIDE